MASLSTESTPRERLDRAISVLGRVRMYWRGAAAMMAVELAHLRPGARHEAGVAERGHDLYRDDHPDRPRSPEQLRARRASGRSSRTRSPRAGRSRASSRRSGSARRRPPARWVEAVEEMKNHVGFRAQSSDTYVVSFTHDDPHVAQQIAARLADPARRLPPRQPRHGDDDPRFPAEGARRSQLKVDVGEPRAGDVPRQQSCSSSGGSTTLRMHRRPSRSGSPRRPAPAALARALSSAQPVRPVDPQLAALERQLAQVEALLGAPGDRQRRRRGSRCPRASSRRSGPAPPPSPRSRQPRRRSPRSSRP